LTNILVTGVGGIGGNNFVRALKLAEKQKNAKLFIVGTDHDPYYLQMPQVDVRFVSPRHDDPTFVPTIFKLIKEYKVQFLHPHPSSEAHVVSENLALFKNANVDTYLPKSSSIAPNKLEIFNALSQHGVPVPKTGVINSLDDVDVAFSKIGHRVWIRAKSGAGGRLGLKINTLEEAKLWVKFNVLQGRANVGDFILQEYLSGKDLAFDSLWFKGKLVTSYARERLEYPLKHVSLSGITATPSVARIVDDKQVNMVGIDAVKALDPKPHGFFSVDIKCNDIDKPIVTEVDGKWHTTAPLWGYAFAKAFNKPELNIAYIYLTLGLSGNLNEDLPLTNLFPSNYYLIRQLDAGVILKRDERIWKII
jgi:glutathione synthase/RimK-type ligase-like ATP-grasp enzyme